MSVETAAKLQASGWVLTDILELLLLEDMLLFRLLPGAHQ